MRHIDEHTITEAVIARHAQATDERLKTVMGALVRHLHDFAREVQLTEAEWFAAIEFLTATGHMSGDKRQEFILLSDTLGLSTLVTAMNQRKPAGCTEATVLGPFHVKDAPTIGTWGDMAQGAKGQPCYVSGSVRSIDGSPVAGATVEVWQADEEGYYDVQRAGLAQAQARATLHTDAQGRFAFRSIVAEPYPIPHDGPVGRMLQALGRHPWRPAHLHFLVTAEGHERLITHLFREGDPYLDSDAVFGVRASLVTDWVRHEAGATPDGGRSEVPFFTLRADLVLNPVRGSAA